MWFCRKDRIMVDVDKVYLMTKAALFEKKEEKGAIKVVGYRRKDYILYHMLLVFLSVSAAYALIVGTIFFMIVMAHDEIVLNVGEMLVITLGIIVIYLVVMVIYYMISHKYYGEKHVRARQAVKTYLGDLRALEHLNSDGQEQI